LIVGRKPKFELQLKYNIRGVVTMKEIEKYMTPAEASHKWGIKRATLKNKISPSTLNEEQKEELHKMIEEGLIKFFLDLDEKVFPCLLG
ncbi:hypothetical protein ACUOA8_37865, partial [Escherichia sp. SS-MK2]